ncbi:hypothetical protein, partial [Klebsiella pneumoniae]|uniref:hypothetical protein n=1 Tax=Klebsiella pneumoniae TaxID=573 RepID=UPI001C6FEFED
HHLEMVFVWKQNYILVDEYFFFCCTWIVNSASIPAHTLSMTGTKPFPEKPPAVSTQAASLFPAGSLPIDFRGGPFTHSTAGMLRGIKSGLE